MAGVAFERANGGSQTDRCSAIELEHEVENTEEVVDKSNEFLDQVSPGDFKRGESYIQRGRPAVGS